MSDPQVERLARQLHLLEVLERLRRHGRCDDTWAECDESKREQWRMLARDTISAYAADDAREN